MNTLIYKINGWHGFSDLVVWEFFSNRPFPWVGSTRRKPNTKLLSVKWHLHFRVCGWGTGSGQSALLIHSSSAPSSRQNPRRAWFWGAHTTQGANTPPQLGFSMLAYPVRLQRVLREDEAGSGVWLCCLQRVPLSSAHCCLADGLEVSSLLGLYGEEWAGLCLFIFWTVASCGSTPGLWHVPSVFQKLVCSLILGDMNECLFCSASLLVFYFIF